jgi:hypothetical protein
MIVNINLSSSFASQKRSWKVCCDAALLHMPHVVHHFFIPCIVITMGFEIVFHAIFLMYDYAKW